MGRVLFRYGLREGAPAAGRASDPKNRKCTHEPVRGTLFHISIRTRRRALTVLRERLIKPLSRVEPRINSSLGKMDLSAFFILPYQ